MSRHDGPRLAWRADRAVRMTPNGTETWLFGGPGPVRLGGHDAGALARAITLGGTVDDILGRAAAEGMDPVEAQRILGLWQQRGHVVVAGPEQSPGATARVVGLDPQASALTAVLTSAGVTIHTDEESDAPIVVAIDNLLRIDDVEIGSPMIAVQLASHRALVSPWLDAPTCRRCLATRLRNRRTPDLVAAQRVGLDSPPASPARYAAAIPLVAGVVITRLSDRTGTELSVIDPVAGTVSHDRVVPVPGCPRCDPGGTSVVLSHLDRAPIDVEPTDGQTGGGYRGVDPEETWERYSPLIGETVGIVPFVRRVPGPFRAYTAGANPAATDDVVTLASRLRSQSGGKGLTLSAARTGALAEALERDSMRARGDEPTVRARISDLDDAIHPNDIQLFSDQQCERAAALLALGIDGSPDGPGHRSVPVPFDTDAEHDWSPVADWTTGERRWMPASLMWFGWPVPPGHPTGSSNGAASGNTIEEAVLQGLLELVERDSVALWWHPRCRRPAIDLDSWDDPRITAALAPQRVRGTEAWVLDVSSDLGIPAAVAVATGLHTALPGPLLGFGAHVDPVLAVTRALGELAQMQATLLGVAESGRIDIAGEAERAWFTEVTPDSEPWLAPHGLVRPEVLPAVPDYRSLHEALEDVVARIRRRGYDVLWADATRRDIGMPVVRTWAPGLRHFWNRYGPGRLFDVPPTLGWCEPGYTEADLNPRPMIL